VVSFLGLVLTAISTCHTLRDPPWTPTWTQDADGAGFFALVKVG